MPDFPRPPDKPTLCGFNLQSMLGQGGTGTVYLGVHPETGQVAALKQFNANFFRHKLHLKDLQRTANKFKKFEHPNVVKVLDFLAKGDDRVLLMEYVDGPNLEWYIENRPYNIPEMISILAQMCNGLSYIHDKGFVHHDLKPANVLFTRKGVAKVADYSLAGSSFLLQMLDQGMTEQITPLYVAPELIRKEKPTKAVDLYSLGIIMYLMFARQSPFKVDNLARLYQCHLNDMPFHPSDMEQRVPRAIGDAIMKLLSKKPKNRYNDCDEVRIVLSSIDDGGRI